MIHVVRFHDSIYLLYDLGFKDQYQFESKLLGVYNKSIACYYLGYQNDYIYPTILQQLIDSYLSIK